jgi:hypothetical protein
MPVSLEARRKLIHYFATHPAWVKAAQPLGEGVCSALRWMDDPEPWRLIRRDGISILEPGEPENPDFSFVFSEGAVEYLTGAENGTIGDFATRLYECCFLLDADRRVDFQVIAPISQILKRGYWKVALKGGFQVMKMARAHGIGSAKDIRRIFGLLRGQNSAAVREAILSARKTSEHVGG